MGKHSKKGYPTTRVAFFEAIPIMMVLLPLLPAHDTPIDWDELCVLDFTYHNHTVQAADAVYVAERVEHEVLVVLHVVGIHLDEEVVIARRVVALRDLVDALHPIHKILYQVVGVLLQAYVAERDDIVPHFARIHLRCIARDEAFALQTLLPFKRG